MKPSLLKILCGTCALLLLVPGALADKEQDLLAVLGSQADVPAKCDACRELRIVGTAKAVPALAGCLNKERIAHAARYALEGMPFPEATKALRDALSNTSGTNKAGIIDSLGWKRDTASIAALASLLTDGDPAIASAAASSLGRIGGNQAVEALTSARSRVAPAVSPTLLAALLRCGDGLLAGGDSQAASKLFSSLAQPGVPQPIRQAAWRGVVLSDSSGGGAQIFSALAGTDAPLRVTALKVLREAKSNVVAEGLNRWATLDGEAQLALLDASGRFPDLRARALVLAMEAAAFPVRQTAWMALSELPSLTPAQIKVLVKAAAEGQSPDREAGHEALLVLHGDAVVQNLKQLCENEPSLRPELLRLFGQRANPGAEELLLKYAAQQGATRDAALTGLRNLASMQTIKPLLALAASSSTEADAQPVLEAINGAYQRNKDNNQAASTVMAATKDFNEVQRGRVLPLLAEVGTPEALELVMSSTRGADPGLRNSALRTLADWPTAAPGPALVALAKSSQDPLTRTLALRGAIKVASHENDLSKKLALFKEMMPVSRIEEKRLALSEMGQIPTAEALAAVLEQMKNPELLEESALAAVSVAETLAASDPAKAAETAKAVQAVSKAPETLTRARELVAGKGGDSAFIRDWLVAGPFSKPGVEGAEAIFNVAFGPETGQETKWKALPRSDQLNLLSVFPGQENCVAYLNAQLVAPAACEATLLIGSDDGVKVWMNSKAIHSNNTDRNYVVDQDKIPFHLRAGANEMLMKVSQGGGGWAVSARVVGADGGSVPGLGVEGVNAPPDAVPKKGKAQGKKGKQKAHAPAPAAGVTAQLPPKDNFKKIRLDEQFYAEGAYYADFNRDGKLDIVAGPFWFEGPAFEKRHEYRPVKTFKAAQEYSDNFLTFAGDFNNDGWPDILCVPFPGKEGYWYENTAGKPGEWKRHLAFDSIGNESPVWGDLLGKGSPQLLLCTNDFLGYITPDTAKPDDAWTFHAISTPDKRYKKFTHGVGFGDINGDKRNDVVEAAGWWEQPARLVEGKPWTWHPFQFADKAAQMYVYDVNGDGHGDVITSWNCHGYGLLWWEQVRNTEGAIDWRQHIILTPTPNVQSSDFRVSQMHAMTLADMNGDGVMDMVTGKRFWSHGPNGDVEPNAAAIVFWVEVRRGTQEPTFIPHLIDDDSGVGTQVTAVDLNGDKKPDIVVANKKGIFVHLSQGK